MEESAESRTIFPFSPLRLLDTSAEAIPKIAGHRNIDFSAERHRQRLGNLTQHQRLSLECIVLIAIFRDLKAGRTLGSIRVVTHHHIEWPLLVHPLPPTMKKEPEFRSRVTSLANGPGELFLDFDSSSARENPLLVCLHRDI